MTRRRHLLASERLAARILLLGGARNREVSRLLDISERRVSAIKAGLRALRHAEASALQRLSLGEIGLPSDDDVAFERLAAAAHAFIDARRGGARA